MFTTSKLMGAGGVGGAFRYIGAGIGDGTTVTLSQAPQAGDIILVSAHDFATTPTTSWVSIPSGYTRITRAARNWNASYAGQVDMGYKIANGSEGVTISGFTWTSVGALVSIAAVYRPGFSVSTVTPKDVTAGTNLDFTSTTVDASASIVPSISFIAMTGITSIAYTNSTTMDFAINHNNSATHVYAAGLAQLPPASDITMSGLAGGLGFAYTHTYLEIT